jgi:hypothetical protein
MPDNVYSFNVTLLPIALGEIDQTRALRAQDVHPKAKSFRLSISVHGYLSRKGSFSSVIAQFPPSSAGTRLDGSSRRGIIKSGPRASHRDYRRRRRLHQVPSRPVTMPIRAMTRRTPDVRLRLTPLLARSAQAYDLRTFRRAIHELRCAGLCASTVRGELHFDAARRARRKRFVGDATRRFDREVDAREHPRDKHRGRGRTARRVRDRDRNRLSRVSRLHVPE